MLFWILLILQIVTGIISGEAAIRKTSEGAVMLNKLAKAGLFFLHFRAYANYKKELFGLQKSFGISAIIFSILYFVLAYTKSNNILTSILPGLFILFWAAMQIGTNFKKTIMDQFSMIAILALAPWFLYLLDYTTGFNANIIHTFAVPLSLQYDISQYSNLSITLILSGLFFVFGLFTAIFAIIFLSIIPLFFLFLLVSSSKVSKKMLSIPPSKLYNVSTFYFFLIGPLLIGLESKGFI